MRWGRSYAGLCAASLMLASCASKKPAEAPKAAEIAAAAPEPAPDLSPVKAPADVIAVARGSGEHDREGGDPGQGELAHR